MRFANFEALNRVSGGQSLSKNLALLILRMFTLSFLIFSASGAIFWYTGLSSDNNFILAIDASGSMLAGDIQPNRLEAAKESALSFVDNLQSKAKIGVVSFSGVGFVESVLTEDKIQIREAIDGIEIKTISGTAIGDALKSSTNLLIAEKKASIVILLTDGRENVAGQEEMDRVMEYVNENFITVYTIGVGTQSGGSIPGLEAISTLDEETLSGIAEQTGGKFFLAEDKEALDTAYTSIATSAEANLPVKLGVPFMLVALALLFIEWGLVNTKYRTIP